MNSSNTEVINSPPGVPRQGRANGFPCCCVPDPHGAVVAAASNILACRGEAHTIHIIAAQRNRVSTNSQQKAFYTREWDVPVPGQGRLALKCARRPYGPDLDGVVRAACDKLLAARVKPDAQDRPARRWIVSKHHDFEQSMGKQVRTRCARSGSTDTPLIRCPKF